MIDIEKTILEKSPEFKSKLGGKQFISFLKKLSHEQEINEFIKKNQHFKGFSLLDKVLEHFDFSYQVDNKSLDNIPAEGRLIIVANHPIGSLDGLAILKLIHSIRSDVKIVASRVLSMINPLQDLFLPVNNIGKASSYKSQIKAMEKALEKEQAIIIFPAGEVSRIRPNGVKDGKWKAGFLKLAEKMQSPILPVYINAKNSALFYALSSIYKPLGTMMLVKEMFNKHSQTIQFHIGNLVPWKSIGCADLDYKALAKTFRKHVYLLEKPKKAAKKLPFKTETTVIHPVEKKSLKKALKEGQLLGKTGDNKLIFLFEYDTDSIVMREIGRLRELTFRAVEEGTGTAIDLDHYDANYQHLVLWDEEDLEIVGAYRIGNAANILKKHGKQGLYTNSLFELDDEILPYLDSALEMGRSFVQPRYWGKRSLDYLWYGIGAYIKANPKIKYMFGPVSLSDAYPNEAKGLISSFYLQQFGKKKQLAVGRRPFKIKQEIRDFVTGQLSGDYKKSYKKLNLLLDEYGVKVPTLFKQYSELCEEDGCHFIDFSVDPNFNNCIDCLILVEIDKIKEKKYNRYIETFA